MLQLGHDGRLPLQVLGDVGVVDLVKRHHLWSHLLVQNDVVVVGQGHISKWAKGDWGQLVVAYWTEKSSFNHCHDRLNQHKQSLPTSFTWELGPSDCRQLQWSNLRPAWQNERISFPLWLGFLNKSQQYLFLEKILFLKSCSSYFFVCHHLLEIGW